MSSDRAARARLTLRIQQSIGSAVWIRKLASLGSRAKTIFQEQHVPMGKIDKILARMCAIPRRWQIGHLKTIARSRLIGWR
jgi:hypothetical protein